MAKCIGITGHQRLVDPSGWASVRTDLVSLVSGIKEPLVGISSLAAGADQLFATVILERRGELRAILPFPRYREKLSGAARAELDRLVSLAVRVEVLPRVGDDEDCYLNAGRKVADAAEVLVAVWDGRAARGKGGTGDIVAYARLIGRSVHLIDVSPWR